MPVHWAVLACCALFDCLMCVCTDVSTSVYVCTYKGIHTYAYMIIYVRTFLTLFYLHNVNTRSFSPAILNSNQASTSHSKLDAFLQHHPNIQQNGTKEQIHKKHIKNMQHITSPTQEKPQRRNHPTHTMQSNKL